MTADFSGQESKHDSDEYSNKKKSMVSKEMMPN